MKNLSFVYTLAAAAALLLLPSCKSSKYMVTSGSENLSGLTKITDNSEQSASSITVSPNSPTIFIALGDNGSRNIYRKDNPTSAAMAQITSGQVMCSWPAYNPTTDRIAFTYSTRYGTGWSKNDIYTLGLKNTNALSPVTQTATIEEYSPSFSPNGNIVCYQSGSGDSGELWVKNLKTNETTLLGSGMMPQISPDGKKIVFCRYQNSSYNSPASIWLMNIDGTNVVEVKSNSNQRMLAPSWSPDGKKIVFQAASKKGFGYKNWDIYVMDVDGGGLTQLTTNNSDDTMPVWSKDGYIYFISDRGAKKGDLQVWRFKAN